MVAQLVVEVYPQAQAESLRDKIVTICTASMTKTITVAVTKHLRQVVPPRVKFNSTADLVTRVARVLPLPLGRALVHSLVPAFIQTLSHNPAVDYYCYYCYKYKQYCEYCSHQPQQMYHAQYYAGFYSAYYTDYFGRFYANLIDIDAKAEAANKLKAAMGEAAEKVEATCDKIGCANP